jgi:hypothetical protein
MIPAAMIAMSRITPVSGPHHRPARNRQFTRCASSRPCCDRRDGRCRGAARQPKCCGPVVSISVVSGEQQAGETIGGLTIFDGGGYGSC